jgi:general secretion pathway protein G
VYHYPGKGSGFLWTVFGKQAHPLTGLDFLPTNTVMACCSDADLAQAWSVLEQEVKQANIPQAEDWLARLPEEFQQKTQIKWDPFLASLGGEYEIVVTFDESKKIPVPLPSGERLDVPEPALLLIAKVNDDTIFNRIDTALKDTSQVTRVDQPGLKMRTVLIPLPLPIQLRPTIASSGGYLLIGSSDTIVQEALAVKNGRKPGLQTTAEFKHLAQDVPQEGNQFTFVSPEFGRIVFEAQKQMLALQKKTSPAQTRWMQSLFHPDQAFYTYTVAANTADGWLTVGNGNQTVAQAVLVPMAAAPVGLLSAIAIPNFIKARETAQRNACINNLREIDAAKQQWALEKGKRPTDVPTWDDLKPYLGKIPHCPAGGTYTINAVGEPPQCSVPGHVLPP